MSGDSCRETDLTAGRTGWLLWRAPWVLVVAGLAWTRLVYALWIPAFSVMGAACIVNATRCHRTHCYVTGPLYLAAAGYLVLAALSVVPLVPAALLLVVLGIGLAARFIEGSVGTYREAD